MDIETTIPVLHTRVGPIELDTGLPATLRDADQLLDASDFQRACQAYLWSLPLVGFLAWRLYAPALPAMPTLSSGGRASVWSTTQ